MATDAKEKAKAAKHRKGIKAGTIKVDKERSKKMKLVAKKRGAGSLKAAAKKAAKTRKGDQKKINKKISLY